MKKLVLSLVLLTPFSAHSETLRDFYTRELLPRFHSSDGNCGTSLDEQMELRHIALTQFVEEFLEKRKNYTDSPEVLELDRIAVKEEERIEWYCARTQEQWSDDIQASIEFSYDFAEKIIEKSDAQNVSRETFS